MHFGRVNLEMVGSYWKIYWMSLLERCRKETFLQRDERATHIGNGYEDEASMVCVTKSSETGTNASTKDYARACLPERFFESLLRNHTIETCRPADLERLFSRLAVGCVVLEREHPGPSAGDEENPWRRYAQAGIALARQPALVIEHKNLIEEAGVRVIYELDLS